MSQSGGVTQYSGRLSQSSFSCAGKYQVDCERHSAGVKRAASVASSESERYTWRVEWSDGLNLGTLEERKQDCRGQYGCHNGRVWGQWR